MIFSKKQLQIMLESLIRYKNSCTFFSKQFENHGFLKAHKIHDGYVTDIEEIIDIINKKLDDKK